MIHTIFWLENASPHVLWGACIWNRLAFGNWLQPKDVSFTCWCFDYSSYFIEWACKKHSYNLKVLRIDCLIANFGFIILLISLDNQVCDFRLFYKSRILYSEKMWRKWIKQLMFGLVENYTSCKFRLTTMLMTHLSSWLWELTTWNAFVVYHEWLWKLPMCMNCNCINSALWIHRFLNFLIFVNMIDNIFFLTRYTVNLIVGSIPGVSFEQMKLQIKLGVPRCLQQSLDIEKVKSVFP